MFIQRTGLANFCRAFGGIRANGRTLEQVAIAIARQYGGALLYAKSNLSNLWQNSNGTGTVTTTGGPIGLWLDQSFNGELGAELIVNGTFDTGLSGWTVGTDPAQVIPTWNAGGTVTLTRGAGGNAGFSQNVSNIVAGRSYRVSGTVLSGTTTLVLSNAAVGSYTSDFSVVITATANTVLLIWCGLNSTTTIDNISVREVLGFHATQATGANKPVTTTINGNFAISSDGTNDSMSITSPAITNACTITWAGRVNAIGGSSGVIFDQANGLLIDVNTSGQVRIFNRRTATQIALSNAGTVVLNTPLVLSFTQSPSGWVLRKNGVVINSGATAHTFLPASTLLMVSASNTSNLNAITAEYFIGNQAVPDADLLQIERFGAQRLGITL